ncbi:hypothetical protein CHELA1G11_11154 [Hyphomicrobiales bacterium]|nr:hypothetical protein CHELA1G11_11154 [Hyphomicrobiales bacterium]CAH1669750.1 hypothetical protein CHELA1G2_13155 [Hyphomicrobiales bacterium]
MRRFRSVMPQRRVPPIDLMTRDDCHLLPLPAGERENAGAETIAPVDRRDKPLNRG